MRKIIIGVIVLAVIVGVVLLVNSKTTGNAIKRDDAKVFSVSAFRFGYTPDLIQVSKGDRVRIEIENTDTLHGIRIPELNLKGNEVIEFTADKTGEFVWYCTNMCGEGHMTMKGKLVVR